MNIKIGTKPRLWYIKPYPTNLKKRTLMQRFKAWRKANRKQYYAWNGQIAMF
jgi:hypothetical protein